MTIETKTKSKKRRKIALLALPLLLLFLIVWHQHGIGPSSDTIALRQELADTTKVEVRYTNDAFFQSKPKVFMLQDQEARDFVHSILLLSETRKNIYKRRQYLGAKWYECKFYRDAKLITELTIIDIGGEGRILWLNSKQGSDILYPTSYRHIRNLFEEHTGITAK